MQRLIPKLGNNIYTASSFVKKARIQRFQAFLELVKPPRNARVIDLGGTSRFWQLIDHDFDVTLVNLPGEVGEPDQSSRCKLIEGDATNLTHVFDDLTFDVVFSNSVIEHVGDAQKKAAFAREVQRLAKAYWIQTPSDRFPIEAHTGVLFYWQLPRFFRANLIHSWKEKTPAWAEMIEGTTVLSRKQMQKLFPEAELYTEQKFFLEKSYAAYFPFQ